MAHFEYEASIGRLCCTSPSAKVPPLTELAPRYFLQFASEATTLACCLMGDIMAPPPSYPIHPSVANRLHPQYLAFYNKHLLYAPQAHLLPLKASRENGKPIPGARPSVPVGRTVDFFLTRRETAGPEVRIRSFTPPGPAPAEGWPVLLYSHGGGWVFGDIDSENSACTRMCIRANCVVITSEYRYVQHSPRCVSAGMPLLTSGQARARAPVPGSRPRRVGNASLDTA